MQDLVDHHLIETIQMDVCDVESVKAAREEVERLLDGKGLDVLVNNACALLFLFLSLILTRSNLQAVVKVC
jgi:NAD(P)-dependent dehydrogenase (short-subunit alcohol dehydrogenase family)